ncbi:leucine-rich repeat domain-containing protein [Flavobacterium sp.]|uniref:leucine-rich repeat domain-containing protein n=1 Tax=Flavobacterium sp. TaxID=239 RepID=UPI002637E926|nr:leucine-rich repeat domain-containing protein [Flavobacterium sp.]
MKEERIIRINKVLRELNISLETAINYLKSQEILIEANPNSKISDKEFELLQNKFGLNSKPNNIQILETELKLTLVKLDSSSNFTNENRNCYQIDENNNVIGIKIRYANLKRLPSIFISFLTLKYLDLSCNNLTHLSDLSNLKELTYLNIENNNFKDLIFLDKMSFLTYLSVSQNQILDYTSISKCKELKFLHLQNNKLKNIDFLLDLKNLIELDISFNELEDVSVLINLKNIEVLCLSLNKINNFNFLPFLVKLKKLYIGACQIKNISFLKGLNIELLNIGENPIEDYSPLKFLNNLSELRINNSHLTDVTFIKDLKGLIYLHLHDNKIRNISFFSKLKKIAFIDVSRNEIEDISEFEFIEEFQNLNIIADDNPCFDRHSIIFNKSNTNGFKVILNELKKLNDKQVSLRLPEKILLLGNHFSGKSSLLNYLQNGNLDFQSSSTHILKIENYPLKFKSLPKAIVYDFGGQDFYHGIYNAFLTINSTTILLWNNSTNSNFISCDSQGRRNINYDVKYWMGQRLKNEFEGEVIIVQTRADEIDNNRYSYLNEYQINEEFYVSLKNESENQYHEKFKLKTLDYLKESIDYIIDKKQIEKNKKGKISINSFNLIQYIINSEETHIPVLKKDLQKYYNVNNEERFETELEQLELQGMICTYNDKVWLKPVALAKYFHDKILEDKLICKGIVEKEVFEEKIEENVKDFLLAKRVIYLLKNKIGDLIKEDYIIPNYLPLSSDSEMDYSLMTFGFDNPLFVIKYKDYIPFGFINQIIIKFGNIFDSSRLWRDQLLFKISYKNQNIKVLIKLDYTELKVRVYTHFEKNINPNYKNIIETYLFRKIVKSYNKFSKRFNSDGFLNNNFDDYVSENTFLSKDDINFIFYKDLKDFDLSETKIRTYSFNSLGEKFNEKEIAVSKFQNFTIKNLKSMKKVFISYSNEDHYYKDLLIKNLKPLTQFQLLKPWSCEDMTSGNWHDQIQNELKESEIVIFMMSLNFITSDYILREEVFKTFEEIKNNPNKKVICVLVKNFAWQYFDKFKKLTNLTDEDFVALQDANTLNELTSKQFVPYDIENKGTQQERRFLKPLNKWEYEEDAYVEIVRNIVENLS